MWESPPPKKNTEQCNRLFHISITALLCLFWITQVGTYVKGDLVTFRLIDTQQWRG